MLGLVLETMRGDRCLTIVPMNLSTSVHEGAFVVLDVVVRAKYSPDLNGGRMA